jgi:hypothetical protein
MHHFRALRTRTWFAISLILGFAPVTFGCATDDLVSGRNRAADADFRLTAEAAPEGLLLTLSNIPPDTNHLWITVQEWFNTEEPVSSHNIVSSYAGITDASVRGWVHGSRQLEKIKQTGKVIFPIVQAGKKYHISAMAYNEQNYYASLEYPRMAETECTAGNGIYFNRDSVKLELDNAHSTVTLSSEPVFSSEVTFDTQKYSYGVTVYIPENRAMGVGDHHTPGGLSSDGLTWIFEPYMTADLRNDNGGWLESGNTYSAWAEVKALIIYDDITWSVGIAKTPEFNYRYN